jgi:hypothetical protein
MTGQPPGQLILGMVITAARAAAKLIGAIPLSQPAGEPQLGNVIPGVGQRPDSPDGLLGPGPVGWPAGQLPPGVLISGQSPRA